MCFDVRDNLLKLDAWRSLHAQTVRSVIQRKLTDVIIPKVAWPRSSIFAAKLPDDAYWFFDGVNADKVALFVLACADALRGHTHYSIG